MGKKIKVFVGIVLLLLICGALLHVKRTENQQTEYSVFSWKEHWLEEEKEQHLLKVMQALDITTIYQYISNEEDELVLSFLKRRSDAGHKVYLLQGEPDWAMEPDATSMIEVVEQVALWNVKAGENKGFEGIVFDVEPYLLEEWDENPSECMEQYITNCHTVYDEATRYGLKIILCIPYFYDSKGYTSQLEELISTGCDAVAVMNYNKSDEAGQIQTEVSLADRYGKQVINITEMQEPEKHGLKEKNTYYYDGIDAVMAAWNELRKMYDKSKMAFSWHYFDVLVELLEETKE